MAARVNAGGGTGCARRRRERRLRSHLRHERMAVAMALAESTHHSAQRQKTARAGREARDALHGHVPEASLPIGAGQHLCLRLLAGRIGSSGTPWTRLSMPCRGHRLSMFLCRRWWTNCCRFSRLSTPSFPSRLSKCPRFRHLPVALARFFPCHSWRNSWWKSRQSSPFPRCSGLWSRPVVVDEVEVFTVYTQDSVLKRLVEQIIVFQQQLPSKSLTFPVPRGAPLDFHQDPPRAAGSTGFARYGKSRVFSHFSPWKKVRSWLRTRVRGCTPVSAHPRRLLSWRSRPCRTPSSGCSSGNASQARPTTGTDVLTVQSGRHQLVSRSCGLVKGMRREGSGTGTGIRVSVRMTSLLFLLGEERYRQPRAVYKYWAPCRLCCVEIFFTMNNGHWFAIHVAHCSCWK